MAGKLGHEEFLALIEEAEHMAESQPLDAPAGTPADAAAGKTTTGSAATNKTTGCNDAATSEGSASKKSSKSKGQSCKEFLAMLEDSEREAEATLDGASAVVGRATPLDIGQGTNGCNATGPATRGIFATIKDTLAPTPEELEQKKARRKEKLDRKMQENMKRAWRRHNFIYDDTVRIWRDDAQEFMTDYEYVDWYEGYYYEGNDEPY